MIQTVEKVYVEGNFTNYKVTYNNSDRVILCLQDTANRHYQEILDEIINGNTSIFGDSVPEELQTDADAKLFKQQYNAYGTAVERLAQYQVALGREEVREMQPTGEQVFNEETLEMEDVMHEVVVVQAIEPVEATVEITVYDENNPEAEPTIQTIENPLITKDNQERAEAQAVVDSTPQAVIDAWNEV